MIKVEVNGYFNLYKCKDGIWDGAFIWSSTDYSALYTFLVDVDSLEKLGYNYEGYRILEVNGIRCIPLTFSNTEVERVC